MSENTIRPRSRAFCDVERCKHCENKRCDVRTLKDVDGFTITDPNKCNDYDPKPQKKFNVTLNEDQLAVLMDLLGPSSDEGEPNEELCNKLYDLSHFNPVATNMYYVNVYDIDQAYGGPEEGGWYYHTHDCHTSIGIFCDPCDGESQFTRDHRFDELITTALQYLQSFEPKWQDDGAPREIFNDLNEYGCFAAYDTDKYGCGELVEISRTPGNRHDTRRQYYE